MSQARDKRQTATREAARGRRQTATRGDAATEKRQTATQDAGADGRSENLRDSPMMAHLMDALQAGTDINHYGRLTFAMVARHFLDEDELVKLLANQPDHGEEDARALLRQMEARNYNPPKRERILEWQAQQDFPICPTPDDPGSCNVYSELRFPDDIYHQIGEFWEERAQEAR
jgi:hypothetical protein